MNPFTWDDSASLINSQVLNLEFTSEGHSLPISNLTEPITIDINSNNTPTAQEIDVNDTVIYSHVINITSPQSSMQIIIKTANQTKLEVFGKFGITVSPDEYDFNVTLPRDLDNDTLMALSSELREELESTVVVPVDLIRNSSEGDALYLAIRKWGKHLKMLPVISSVSDSKIIQLFPSNKWRSFQ